MRSVRSAVKGLTKESFPYGFIGRYGFGGRWDETSGLEIKKTIPTGKIIHKISQIYSLSPTTTVKLKLTQHAYGKASVPSIYVTLELIKNKGRDISRPLVSDFLLDQLLCSTNETIEAREYLFSGGGNLRINPHSDSSFFLEISRDEDFRCYCLAFCSMVEDAIAVRILNPHILTGYGIVLIQRVAKYSVLPSNEVVMQFIEHWDNSDINEGSCSYPRKTLKQELAGPQCDPRYQMIYDLREYEEHAILTGSESLTSRYSPKLTSGFILDKLLAHSLPGEALDAVINYTNLEEYKVDPTALSDEDKLIFTAIAVRPPFPIKSSKEIQSTLSTIPVGNWQREMIKKLLFLLENRLDKSLSDCAAQIRNEFFKHIRLKESDYSLFSEKEKNIKNESNQTVMELLDRLDYWDPYKEQTASPKQPTLTCAIL